MSNRVSVDAQALNALCEEAQKQMALRDLVAQIRSSVTAEEETAPQVPELPRVYEVAPEPDTEA